jgi:hypothetical protein
VLPRGGTRSALTPGMGARMGMQKEEQDRHALLTHLTSILLGLQLLQRRTPMSAQQARVLAESLRSAQAMGLILVTQIVESGGAAGGPHEPASPGRIRRHPSRDQRAAMVGHRRRRGEHG